MKVILYLPESWESLKTCLYFSLHWKQHHFMWIAISRSCQSCFMHTIYIDGINPTLGWILWHIPDFLAPRFLETASQPVGFFLIYIKLGLDWKRLALSASEPLQVGSAQIFFGIVLERKNFAFSLSSARKFTFSTTLKFSRDEEWTRKSLWYPLYFGKRPM